MEFGEVMALVVIFGSVAAVILVPQWLRTSERRRALDALVQAAERGVALPPEPVNALMSGIRRQQRDDLPVHVRDTRRGTLLLAVTAGLVLVGVAVGAIVQASGANGAVEAFVAIASVGCIPGMIGVAYLLLARSARRAAGSESKDL